MFYKQFIKICEINNVKPTPVIKALGYSSGNLKRWQNGSTVNSDILVKLSNYFNVPIDYFFQDYDTFPDSIDILGSDNSFTALSNVIKMHSDHIASLVPGISLSAHNLIRISKYLNCLPEYLVKKDIDELQDKNSFQGNDIISAKDLILNIFMKLPESEEYQYLQVRISSIIISNLAKKNITMENLIAINLSERKIRSLYDLTIPAERKKGLNYSDLMRISEAFNVSYDFMFTGNGN